MRVFTEYKREVDRFSVDRFMSECYHPQPTSDRKLSEWVVSTFELVPAALVYTLHNGRRESLRRLDEMPDDSFYFMWPCTSGFLLHPRQAELEKRIRKNPRLVSQFGFLVYDSPDLGILLGVDIRVLVLQACQIDFLEQRLKQEEITNALLAMLEKGSTASQK